MDLIIGIVSVIALIVATSINMYIWCTLLSNIMYHLKMKKSYPQIAKLMHIAKLKEDEINKGYQ